MEGVGGDDQAVSVVGDALVHGKLFLLQDDGVVGGVEVAAVRDLVILLDNICKTISMIRK